MFEGVGLWTSRSTRSDAVTEAEWLTATDPKPMLEFLRGKASDRKLRLFACACCRRVDECLTEQMRNLVEIAERVAERLVDERERKTRRTEAMRAAWHPAAITRHARGSAQSAVFWALARQASEAARETADHARLAGGTFAMNTSQAQAGTARQDLTSEGCMLREGGVQATLLHDIFGNPFRPSPPLPPGVLKWNDSTVLRIGQGLYEDRKLPEGTLDTGRLAILADALLDAGCDNDDLIQHCREPGPHVRGCCAIDLILGKE
jgi:hypothetical protein